jgi:hypothetical protein
VLTEIDANGAKLRTFVYAGGSVLAWQVSPGPYARVVWEHRDASGASFRTTDVSGSPSSQSEEERPAELDPTGANAGNHAPIIPLPPTAGSPSDSLLPYPSFTNPSRPGKAYSVDGIPVTADYFLMVLDNNYHGSFSVSPKRFSHYSVDVDGGLNFDTWKEAARVARKTTGTVIRNWFVSDWDVSSIIPPTLPDSTPQNPVQLPGDLRDRVAARVNNPNTDCADFMKRLIAAAARIDGKAFDYGNDLMNLFDRVKNGGGFNLRQQQDKGNAGFDSRGRPAVYIKPVSTSGGERQIDNIQTNYAGTALNEIMHTAKNSGLYFDRTMAIALSRVLTPDDLKSNPLPKSSDEGINSRYWHPLFLKHCQP